MLDETGIDIHTINNVDALYEFMDNLYHSNEPEYGFNKIETDWYTLLQYATYNSDYCFFFGNAGYGVVFDITDEKFYNRNLGNLNTFIHVMVPITSTNRKKL